MIYKQKPSGFFGTNMASYLTLLGCDSVIVTGTTTSGCVRATVLDAFSLNYRIALAEEGCFDRSQASHAINLCDMNAKYADVVKTSEVLAFFDTLPSGMFDLPKGIGRRAAEAQARREFLRLDLLRPHPGARRRRELEVSSTGSSSLRCRACASRHDGRASYQQALKSAWRARQAEQHLTHHLEIGELRPAPAGSRCACRGSGARTGCSRRSPWRRRRDRPVSTTSLA